MVLGASDAGVELGVSDAVVELLGLWARCMVVHYMWEGALEIDFDWVRGKLEYGDALEGKFGYEIEYENVLKKNFDWTHGNHSGVVQQGYLVMVRILQWGENQKVPALAEEEMR